MIAVRSHVAHGQRCARRDLLLDAQAPRQHRRRGDVGLHVAWRDLRARRRRRARVDVAVCETAMFEMDSRGVERRCLIEAVVERVEQPVIEPESAAHRGLAVAPDIPRKANARLRQKLRAVLAQRRDANHRLRLQHAVNDGVVRRASLRFVPAVGRLEPEAGTHFESRRQLAPCPRRTPRPPANASPARWATERR